MALPSSKKLQLNKKRTGAPIGAPLFYLLAAAAVIVAAVVGTAVVAAAAVAEEQDQDNDPPPVVTAEATAQTVVITTHKEYLQNFFLSDSPLIPWYSSSWKMCSM